VNILQLHAKIKVLVFSEMDGVSSAPSIRWRYCSFAEGLHM